MKTGRPSTPTCCNSDALTPVACRLFPAQETFRWKGKYLPNMNDRETLEVHLNVFGEFDPVLPDSYRNCKFVFLANGSPKLQMKVLDQVGGSASVRRRHDGSVDSRRA